jgi:N-acetylglutamate synthase/N-acetylornithine aminotransferase
MSGVYIKIGDVLTCKCNTPLAKRTNKKTFEVMRFHRGAKINVSITHGDTGTHRIGCDTCGYGYVCIGITDIIKVSDTVTA